MTTCTVNGIPIVEGSDNPCDIDDYTCAFAAAVEAQLTSLDAIVTRTATTVPVAWMRRTTDWVTAVGDSTNIHPDFDTVVSDTDNMVDLNTTSTGFTVNTPGIYTFWYSLRGVTALPSGSSAAPIVSIRPSIFPSFLFLTQDSRRGDVAGQASVTGQGQVNVSASELQTFFLEITSGGVVGNFITWNHIDFGAFYLRDPA
jgi:hypothetical protein